MIVRLATTEDVALIQAAARLERKVELPLEAAQRLVENPRNRVVLAIERESVIGYIIGHLLDRLDGESMVLIYDVFVDEAFRKRGVASQMMALLLEGARSAGVRKAWVFTADDNIAARALYESQRGVADDGQRLYWFRGAT